MDTANVVTVLRRLADADAGSKTLHLPPGLSPQEALRAVRAAVRALESASEPRPQARTSGAVRVHIDGASRGNPGPAGVGVVFLRPDGTVIERLHRGIGEVTNNVAEYSALLLALDRAAALGFDDLEIYSDSELLVRQLQGAYKVRHPALRPLYAEARERIGALRHFAVHHVPRELNSEADRLANRGIDDAMQTGRVPRPASHLGGEG